MRWFALTTLVLACASVASAVASWADFVDSDTGTQAAVVLAGFALITWTLASIEFARGVRKDMALVRDRSRSIADNTSVIATRVEEMRHELFLGPSAHVPGQVSRIEGMLATETYQPHAPPSTTDVPAGGTSVNDIFDRVLVLNLPSDDEKLRTMEETLRSHGIDFERHPAVDGRSSAFDDEWTAYRSNGPTVPTERHLRRDLVESRGAWGYLKTMRSVLQRAIDEGWDSILVFDDDVTLHSRFSELFASVTTELPNDWRVLYLGTALADASLRSPYSKHLFRPGPMANGSYAIGLSQATFAPLIASIDRAEWPFDTGPLREVAMAHPLDVFATNPPLAIADVENSAIRPGRSNAAHAAKHGWTLDDYGPAET